MLLGAISMKLILSNMGTHENSLFYIAFHVGLK